MRDFRREEKKAWAEAGLAFKPLKVDYEPAEIGERGEYMADPIFEKMKQGLSPETMEYMNIHFPLPTGKKVATRKGAFKPKTWTIKNPPTIRPEEVEEFLTPEQEIEPLGFTD